jgi:hypothetical protein
VASYSYGFSAEVGSGPYERLDILAPLTAPVTWQVAVGSGLEAVADEQVFGTLAEAIAAWNAQPPGTVGVIAIADSRSYVENLTGANTVQVPAGSRLLIVAAAWPPEHVPDVPDQQRRVIGRLEPLRLCPHLRGDLHVRGTAPGGPDTSAALLLDGLLLEGNVRVLAGNLGRLDMVHCTLAPGAGQLRAHQSNDRLRLRIAASICGPIDLPDLVPQVEIADSILSSSETSAAEQPALTAPGAAADLRRTTVLGTTTVETLVADDTIFTGRVAAERRQTGCVRFCFVPMGSRTPRRYRCQPDLALEQASSAARESLAASLRPTFTALPYGQPGYAQLGPTCPGEIRAGAEDGSEMGVLSGLQQPQREASLRTALDEYSPFGLGVGIFYVT